MIKLNLDNKEVVEQMKRALNTVTGVNGEHFVKMNGRAPKDQEELLIFKRFAETLMRKHPQWFDS